MHSMVKHIKFILNYFSRLYSKQKRNKWKSHKMHMTASIYTITKDNEQTIQVISIHLQIRAVAHSSAMAFQML